MRPCCTLWPNWRGPAPCCARLWPRGPEATGFQNAAQPLRGHRIRVNGITCGWLAAAEARQPMGLLVKPAHVAGLARYMVSDASGVMTGALVDFDQNVAGADPE